MTLLQQDNIEQQDNGCMRVFGNSYYFAYVQTIQTISPRLRFSSSDERHIVKMSSAIRSFKPQPLSRYSLALFDIFVLNSSQA